MFPEGGALPTRVGTAEARRPGPWETCAQPPPGGRQAVCNTSQLPALTHEAPSVLNLHADHWAGAGGGTEARWSPPPGRSSLVGERGRRGLGFLLQPQQTVRLICMQPRNWEHPRPAHHEL